ncbi:hypothetical protein AB0387_33250 [Streptomyces sp. NPDC089173]|uniref:hypothetical protein n=1 Tax=Streptomyces sp. NPDC089173 TaxID=3154965 RepID=UPI00344C2F15
MPEVILGQGASDHVADGPDRVLGQARADRGLFNGVDAQMDRVQARGQAPASVVLPVPGRPPRTMSMRSSCPDREG